MSDFTLRTLERSGERAAWLRACIRAGVFTSGEMNLHPISLQEKPSCGADGCTHPIRHSDSPGLCYLCWVTSENGTLGTIRYSCKTTVRYDSDRVNVFINTCWSLTHSEHAPRIQ